MVETERIDESMSGNDDSDQRGNGNGNSNYDYDRDDDAIDKNEGNKKQDGPQTHHPLPLKFRFEEESKVVEKSAYEDTVERLFAEYFNCALEEVGCFICPEVSNQSPYF